MPRFSDDSYLDNENEIDVSDSSTIDVSNDTESINRARNSRFNDGTSVVNREEDKKKDLLSTKTINLAIVYSLFALGLIITGVLGMAFSYLQGYINTINPESSWIVSISMLVVSVICMLVGEGLLFLRVGKSKNGVSILGYGLLIIGTSFLISPIVYLATESAFAPLVYTAFFITAGCYLIMALLSGLIKNLKPVFALLIGLGSAVGILFLVQWIMYMAGALSGNEGIFEGANMIFLVLNGVLVLYMIFSSFYGVVIINRVAGKTSFSNNMSLALYLAASLYSNFIALFVRLVYLLLILFGNSRRS